MVLAPAVTAVPHALEGISGVLLSIAGVGSVFLDSHQAAELGGCLVGNAPRPPHVSETAKRLGIWDEPKEPTWA